MNKENIVKGLNCAMDIAKKGIRVIGPVAVAVLYNRSAIQNVVEEIRYNGKVNYDDAVKAITDSHMYSGDKYEAVTLLKVGETPEYYKAITSVIRSNGYSSDKLALIKAMNGKLESKEDKAQA